MSTESFENATPASPGAIRQLPHSGEAEDNLISCCFVDAPGTLARCQAARVTSDTFYDQLRGILYGVILDLYARNLAIEAYVVAEELKSRDLLQKLGGYPFLMEVSKLVATAVEAQFWIDKLKRYERNRAMIRRAQQLIEHCYANDERVTQDAEAIAEVSENRASLRTWTQAVDEAELITRERMKPPEKREKSTADLSWGIPDFDRVFQPIELGELVVIGGYTSSGKSSLLRQVMWSLAAAGHAAMIQTIETLDREEAINLAAHIAGIRSRARLHELHDGDKNMILDAFTKMRVPHFMVSHQEHSLGAMFSRARAFKRLHRLKALGSDYLQIMEDVNRAKTSSDRAIAIAGVTGASKQFATKEEIAMFLLSGFNREYVKANREPVLSDLEGGSAIEKDASRVLLIHIPTDYSIGGTKMSQSLTADAQDQPNFYVKVIQAKGRNQGTSSVGMMFHRETKTFHQLQREKKPDAELL